MGSYLVKWEIDVCADSPLEAAEEALRIQRDPSSIATVFEVVGDKGKRFLADTLFERVEEKRP